MLGKIPIYGPSLGGSESLSGTRPLVIDIPWDLHGDLEYEAKLEGYTVAQLVRLKLGASLTREERM